MMQKCHRDVREHSRYSARIEFNFFWCFRGLRPGGVPQKQGALSVTQKSQSGGSHSAGKAIAGGAWTVIERVTAQVSQLVIFIAAARILSPAEFGAFALVSACAILLLRVAEVGWAQYIMSWSGDETVPRQVLLVAMLSGLLMAAAVGLAGFMLPVFGFAVTTGHLVMLFAFWVLFAATSSAQKGVMIWQDKLKASAACEIIGEISGLVVALAALYSGYGVFALVFGRLAFQSAHVTVSFLVTRLAPMRGLRGADLRELVIFSGQIFSSRMIANLRLYAATFIIGGFLGPASVGYYRAAERLVGSLTEVVGVPTHVLAWSLFRQSRDANDGRITGFQEQANMFCQFLLAAALPVFIWLAIMGEDLITGLLGEEWLPAFPIVAILALARVIVLPSLITEPVLSLAGEIRRLLPFTAVFFALTVALTLLGATFGLHAVAWSQVATGGAILLATLWIHRKYAAIDWGKILYGSWRLIFPVLLGAGVLLFLRDSPVAEEFSPLLRIIGATLLSVPVYIAALALVQPQLRAELRQRIGRKNKS